MTIFNDTLTETVSASEATVVTLGLAIAEPFKSFDLVGPVRAQLPTLAETVNVSSTPSALIGLNLLEGLRISLSQVQNQKSHLTLTDLVSVVAEVQRAYPATLSETVTITPAQLAQAAISVIEALEITETVTQTLLYHLSLSEQIRAADALARFLGAATSDNLTVTDVMAGVAGKGGQIDETITVADTMTPLFILRVIAEDAIEVSAADAIQMIFNDELVEAIELAAAYLGPSGSVTTWAMNTRTAAVTEYQNYAFNSFARMGNKYLGASQDGLYELAGDNDDGSDIIATIRSGFAQWAGTHTGSFKAAYLATRGAGSFVLRVISGDGKVYNYAVTTETMKSAKVNMGKGLRARYFAFELVSTGQDFDLDTLEFIPLVNDRRV